MRNMPHNTGQGGEEHIQIFTPQFPASYTTCFFIFPPLPRDWGAPVSIQHHINSLYISGLAQPLLRFASTRENAEMLLVCHCVKDVTEPLYNRYFIL
jgi:hypothetical protein